MKKIDYLIKNVGFLTIGNFSSKLLVFFLTPLYTSVLSTAEYGTFDYILATVNLLIPIVTVDIVDATLRFTMDNDYQKEGIVSVSLFFYLGGGLLTALLVSFTSCIEQAEIISNYSIFIILLYAVNALSGILSAISRGLGYVKESAESGIIATLVSIGFNILFLLPLHMGITGYFAATIAGTFVQCVFLWVKLNLRTYIRFRPRDILLARKMTEFSRPLILNNIAWWINNVSDRYVVSYYCGVSNNGIYAVAYKIPTILNIFQSVFQQAWILSAVHDYDEEDKDGFFSQTYSMYSFLLIFICSLLIMLDKLLARILYAKEFYKAWEYVPFLCFGFVFLALANYMGGIFQATKKTEIIAYSTLVGAVVNIILDILCTSHFGPVGAALATCISYFVVWQIRILIIKRLMRIRIELSKDYLLFCLILVQVLLCMFYSGIISYLFQILILGIVTLANKSRIILIVKKIMNRVG